MNTNTEQTYAETKKNKRFDWRGALEIAVQEWIEEDEHDDLCSGSSQWVSCACGNQCSIIPRNWEGRPNDTTLENLGTEFYYSIQNRDYQSALDNLAKIEARSAILIAEERAKV